MPPVAFLSKVEDPGFLVNSEGLCKNIGVEEKQKGKRVEFFFVAYPSAVQASNMSIYTMPSLRDLSLLLSHAARGCHSSPLLSLYSLHDYTAS